MQKPSSDSAWLGLTDSGMHIGKVLFLTRIDRQFQSHPGAEAQLTLCEDSDFLPLLEAHGVDLGLPATAFLRIRFPKVPKTRIVL